MSRSDGPLLVLGVGNVLLRDDGSRTSSTPSRPGLPRPGRAAPDTSLVDGTLDGLPPLLRMLGACQDAT
jgi:hypothetical protein